MRRPVRRSVRPSKRTWVRVHPAASVSQVNVPREMVLHARRSGLRSRASELLRARCAATGKRRSVTSIAPRPALARRAWIPLAFAATLVLAVAGVFSSASATAQRF